MRNQQQGLSLIELMISITIGLVLLTGVVQMFLSSRTVFVTQQAISRVQESGRLAVEFMARDIRMAGFMGCMSRNLNIINTLNNSSDFQYDYTVGIEGATMPVSGVPPTGYPTALPGTDIVVVRNAGGNGVNVITNKMSANMRIENIADGTVCASGTSVSGLCEEDIVVVTDCEKSRVFQITNLQSTAGGTQVNVVHSGGGGVPGNAISSWGGASAPPEEQFGEDSEIIKVTTVAYYIANGVSGQPSLWQRVGNQAQELLEGVENMRATYGEDTSGDGIPNLYRRAADVVDWSRVASVRLQLLVRSTEDGVLAEPQGYTFDGVTVANPGDRRLRQVFVNTIAIRSRLP